MRWAFLLMALMACSKKESAVVDAGSDSGNANDSGSGNAKVDAGSDAEAEVDEKPEKSTTDFVMPDAGPSDKKFRHVKIEPGQLAKILAGFPETKRIGENVRYFTEGDIHAIQNRSSLPHDDVTFSTQPIVWSPEGDVEVVVAVGRGKSSSFIVALLPKPEGGFTLASSFIMLNDLSPVALVWDNRSRRELKWTSCWGCNGEDGLVSWRVDEKRVVIVQR